MNFEDQMEAFGVKKSSSHLPYLEWQCKKKVAFTSKKSALYHMRKVKKPFDAYECNICGAWHLTSKGARF